MMVVKPDGECLSQSDAVVFAASRDENDENLINLATLTCTSLTVERCHR